MSSPAAELALRNGALYLPGTGKTRAGSVAVQNGKIAYCGPDDGITAFLGSATQVLDLRGGMLLPGWHDSHIHSVFGGLFVPGCELAGLASRADYLSALSGYARQHPEKSCLRGQGWIESVFCSLRPHKAQLDAVIPERPVLVSSADGHAAWVNSKALALAGIDRDTPDPPGGIIERDQVSGEPIGLLRELAAIDLVTDRLPRPDQDECAAQGEDFIGRMLGYGITAIHDASAFPDSLEACRRLDLEGKLRLRVDASLQSDPSQNIEQLEEFVDLRRRYSGKNLKAGSVKIFLDGTVEGHTAFLLDPYSDRSGQRGEPLWPRDTFFQTVVGLDAHGFRVHVHAMGDGAVRMALDGFQEARRKNGVRDSRHMISHIELVALEDVPRFLELGVIANFQPSWFYQDDLSDAPLEAFLGPSRLGRRFCMRTLWLSGAMVTSGSDWPVGGDYITCDPLEILQTGVTRQGLSGAGRPYMPQERMALGDMLDSMTVRGAFSAFREDQTGSLRTGSRADLAVLDRDLFAIAPQDIHTARVALTVFDGQVAYRHGI